MSAIELKDIGKRYLLEYRDRLSLKESILNLYKGTSRQKEIWALKDINLEIPKGQALGIIGRNGSGKTTLLKLLCGITKPTTGSLRVNGHIVGLLELGAGFQSDLTGRENIYLNGAIMGLTKKEIERNINAIIDFADIGDFIDAPVRTYSAGMYLRLGFAIATHIDFDILLIDEILSVGDTGFQKRCLKKMNMFKIQNKTIVFVSHNLETLRNFCDRAVFLDDGKIVEEGPSGEVIYKYLISLDTRSQISKKEVLPMHEISITNVYFKNNKGEINYIFRRGEEMSIVIEYFAQKRIMNPVFGIGVYAGDSYLIGPNTRDDDCPIDCVEGDGSVEYKIRSIPFADGKYEVSISIHDVEGACDYDSCYRSFNFRVISGEKKIKYGLVGIDGAWSIIKKR